MGRAWRAPGVAIVGAVVAHGGCLPGPSSPPPLGEVAVVVDTDLAVPALVARLRVDLYKTDGTWYETRDLSLPHASDWPVSFAVALSDGEAATDVVLRLRAYPEARVRDYLGERFVDRPSLCSNADCTSAKPDACCPLAVPGPPGAADGPRLLTGDVDVTPPTEPQPSVTVDRLTLLSLEPGVVAGASVLLAGACDGTMADLRDFTSLATCVDTEGARVSPPAALVGAETGVPSASAQGTFGQSFTTPCTTSPRPAGTWNGTPLHDDELCIPGGPFLFGTRDTALGDPRDGLPERLALVSSFLVDRYEVTVARFRKGLADGFTGGTPQPNDGPMGSASVAPGSPTLCTWSNAPLGREEYPVVCLTQTVAQAFCRFAGGDLPTEAEWEYAAAAASRDHKTRLPWGDGSATPPSCNDVVYGRVGGALAVGFADCPGFGASPVTFADHAGGDVTAGPGAGIVDLGGNVSEWVADTFAAFDSNWWLAAPMTDPVCTTAPVAVGVLGVPAGAVSVRGAFWYSLPRSLFAGSRSTTSRTDTDTGLGFRCVRPGGA